jgi:hypothetical protein
VADPLVDLVGATEATAYLAATGMSAPADLDKIITGVSAAMQSYASRNFVSQSYSRVLNGRGGDRVSLPDYPITAVSAVSVDGVTIQPAATPLQSGFVFSDTQVMLRGFRFSPGVQNVAIAYTAGFAAVPADLVRAACEGVAAVVAAFDLEDPRVVEAQTGGTRLKLAQPSDYDRFILTPAITGVLEQRKRVVPV